MDQSQNDLVDHAENRRLLGMYLGLMVLIVAVAATAAVVLFLLAITG